MTTNLPNGTFRIISLFITLFLCQFLFIHNAQSKGLIIPTDSTQNDFLKAYKLAMVYSYVDYRFTSSTIDKALFPEWGEFSIYWVKTGINKGSFIYPDALPGGYSSVSSREYSNYDWQSANHYAIQFKHSTKRVAIFQSKIKRNNRSVSWASIYFKNTFDSYLYDNIYYFIDEDEINRASINSNTQLLIIPSFTLNGIDNKYYIDSAFRITPNMKARLDAFLAAGGTIYAEGNAVYFIEKLGYLSRDAVDFNNRRDPNPATNMIKLNFNNSTNPLSFTRAATGDSLYCSFIPYVNSGSADVIANITGFSPVVFALTGTRANGGKIICNTGLPSVGGINRLNQGSRQLQWVLNAIFYSFAKNIDVNRSIYNELPEGISAGKNAVSYDRIDTFEVRILLRNLADYNVSGIEVKEYIRGFFSFVDIVTPGINSTINGTTLTFSNITLEPNSEKIIVYRLRTPTPDNPIHKDVNNYISWASYIYASWNSTNYTDYDGINSIIKYRNYVDIMFSARIVADTDLNWKNFLGLYYQPFKIFMIMENKERTSAENVKYTQYIPKDVPFYWTDKNINVPILKTPGGKYVDVLKGSNDQNNPQYDMDSDGKPDAWLDTASIYPKGYTLTEESVYWLNPWEHLRSGDTLYYEDIDHDGRRAYDTDGDGNVDVEEPGDKIRVWKVTWNIDRVAGYEYYDPYCYFEIWVDPPDLVNMAAGVGEVYGLLDEEVNGMFYPYSPDLNNANIADTSWKHWMERDDDGNVVWKQMIYQRISNYEGFTFIDTLNENYRLLSTDRCVGTVPQPHREFIAVLSLGGREIDMHTYTPNQSLYSNIEYKTIFNERRITPIRTTYTYYAPLPNPLQFEYLTNCYTITDTTGRDTLKFLPEWGKANLTFDIDASTEYTYYWIRNAGHDVDYNDPSYAVENNEKLGDGVFGYMVYEIPKGIGGYQITLPKKANGSYDVDKIVQVDGHPFRKWLDNENTGDSIEIWEDQFTYKIYIPQLLIPPALDDDNYDGIDDWIDDRGDRFCSPTGFLHDNFMLDNGEQWLDYPEEPFIDDIYGRVDSGWYHGPDNTYGDDFFETLGKTHFKINAIYEGKGKEGPIEISKGGWLVVEEIFGGSPWVIFSHVLSGYSKGVDIKLVSGSNPSFVKYGLDTAFIKHTIYDANEPHSFDIRFDPWHISFGYGETTITSYAGGRDPCNLIEPAINMPAIIDPEKDEKTVTLIPLADTTNPDLRGYPKRITGSFIEARVEVMNGTDDNWVNTKVTPILPSNLGNTRIVMNYVAYPRPLVPSKVDPQTGEIIHSGDELGSFKTGWRFNQPEGEVLVKMGNTLNLLQPSRRAYFIFLIQVDKNLANGVYSVDFVISGERKHYTEMSNVKKGNDQIQRSQLNFEVPSIQFSVTDKNLSGSPVDFQKFVIGTCDLKKLNTITTEYFTGLEKAKWSLLDVNKNDFKNLTKTLPVVYNQTTGVETIDLSQFKEFPAKDLTKFYILEQGEVYSYYAGNYLNLSSSQEIYYENKPLGTYKETSDKVYVASIGPKLKAFKQLYSVNGKKLEENKPLAFIPQDEIVVESLIEVANLGNDIAENAMLRINPGKNFIPIKDKLPPGCTYKDNAVQVVLGSSLPGEIKKLFIPFTGKSFVCDTVYDDISEISSIDIRYNGAAIREYFLYSDTTILNFPAPDFNLFSLESDVPKADYGTNVKLTAKYQNGAIPAKNIWLRIYSIVDETDTTMIGQMQFEELKPLEYADFSINYIVPTEISSIWFFASIDDDKLLPEFCENNNSSSFQLPLDVPLHCDAGDNQVICIDSCSNLNGKVYGGIKPYKITWSPSYGLSDSTSLNPQVCLSKPGIYKYTLKVFDGNYYNSAVDTVLVRVRNKPELASTKEIIDFGKLDACTSSMIEPLELFNNGKEDITIDSIWLDEEFYLEQTILPLELKKGSSHKLEIKYAPSDIGKHIGIIKFFGSPCGVFHSVKLQGEKLNLLVNPIPAKVDFKYSLCLPAVKDTAIIISNTGTDEAFIKFSEMKLLAPFKLKQIMNDQLLLPGEQTKIDVSYTPAASGNFNDILSVPYIAGACFDTLKISLYASHLEPDLNCPVNEIAFPPMLGCETYIDTCITITNTGNTDLRLVGIEPEGIFSTSYPLIISPADSKQVCIRFSPINIGKYSGIMKLKFSPCDKDYSISVTGSKRGIVFNTPDTVFAGELIYCSKQSVSSEFVIENKSDGDSEGKVKNLIIEGPFKTDLYNGLIIAGSESNKISVTFAPTPDLPDGIYYGKLRITLDPCDVVKEIILAGRKTDVAIEPVGKLVDAGLLYSEESIIKEIIFGNRGTASLIIDGAEPLSPHFEYVGFDPPLPASLKPGENLSVKIKYTAFDEGIHKSNVKIKSSNPCPNKFSDAEIMGTTKRTAKFSFRIPVDSSKTGDTITIPVLLDKSEYLTESGIESVSMVMLVNASVLKPIGMTPNGTTDGMFRRIRLDKIPVKLNRDVLYELKFVATLGDAPCSPVAIEKIEFEGGKGVSDIENGLFCLTDICREGGERLFTASGSIKLFDVKPNPAQNELDVEYEIIEKGFTELYLIDIMGTRIKTFFGITADPGYYSHKFDISEIPNGVYMCILRTESHLLNQAVRIVK